MIGSKRNRGRHGEHECIYGCCRPYSPTKKNKVRSNRRTKRQEKLAWRKDQDQ